MIRSYIGLDGSAGFSRTLTIRPDGISPCIGRNNKGFGIVHHKWSKGAARAFHDRFPAFDQVENIKTSFGMVGNGAGKPMPPCFNEREVIKTGTFFPPAFALAQWLHFVEDMFFCPGCGAVPLDHIFPCSSEMGRGFPSRPMRPQSHNLKVKIYGVALISSTTLLAPEQCTVPEGMST